MSYHGRIQKHSLFLDLGNGLELRKLVIFLLDLFEQADVDLFLPF